MTRSGWKYFGLACMLACSGAMSQTMPPRAPRVQASAADVSALLERGRAAWRAGDRYAALAAIAQARRLQPDNAEVAQALADLLMELGAPSAAAQTLGARANPGVRSRVAGQRLRWATSIHPLPPDPRRRFDDVDPALAQLDSLLAEARTANPPDAGLITRLQRDRAVALRQRERWQDALAQVAVLRAAGDEIPIYVLAAEADALLALRRPQEARRAYEDALRRLTPAERADEDGPWRSLMTGLAYAEVEGEDFDAAFASVGALVEAAGPPWRSAGDMQTPRANDSWLEMQAFDAAVRSYADMPAAAWARIEPLKRGAPALAWLRAQAADIAAQRGWSRLAEGELDAAAALEPEDFGIQVQQVDSDIRRHRLQRAEARFAPVWEQGADIPRVQEVGRELDARLGPSVAVDLGGRHTSDQVLRGPGDGGDASLRVESSTFAGAWRLVGLTDTATDSLPEGRAERHRLGGGAQARWPDWKVEALAWSQAGSLDNSGGSLAAQWEPSDHWVLMADAARHSPDTPLRADLHGISADAVRGGLRYAWNESARAQLQTQYMDFSDGNERQQLTLDGALKVLDQPHLDITLRPRIELQRNSQLLTPYFSPRQAWLTSIEAEVEHVMWRAYERSLVQRLRVNAGVFDQRAFGSNGVGSVAYEQGWRNDPWTELSWGLEWASNVYDGQREHTVRAYLALQHRFGR